MVRNHVSLPGYADRIVREIGDAPRPRVIALYGETGSTSSLHGEKQRAIVAAAIGIELLDAGEIASRIRILQRQDAALIRVRYSRAGGEDRGINLIAGP